MKEINTKPIMSGFQLFLLLLILLLLNFFDFEDFLFLEFDIAGNLPYQGRILCFILLRLSRKDAMVSPDIAIAATMDVWIKPLLEFEFVES